MKMSVFLSAFIILSISLPVAISFVDTLGDTILSCESCTENQTEEEGAEEKESYDEIEALFLDDFYISSFSSQGAFDAASKKKFHTNINREILTPPPQVI